MIVQTMKILTVVLSFTLMFSASGTAGDEELTLCGIQGSRNHSICFSILTEAYGRLGLSVSELPMPSKRSLVQSSSGFCDGEVQRIARIGELYPSLLMVPEPLITLESYAFIVDPAVSVRSVDDLSKYVIGIPRGIVNLEKMTEGLNRIFVKDHNQLMTVLENGRVDLVITSKTFGMDYFKNDPDTNITMVEPPLTVKPLYHFLHSTHKDLIPRITEVIKEMKTDGSLAQIINSAD